VELCWIAPDRPEILVGIRSAAFELIFGDVLAYDRADFPDQNAGLDQDAVAFTSCQGGDRPVLRMLEPRRALCSSVREHLAALVVGHLPLQHLHPIVDPARSTLLRSERDAAGEDPMLHAAGIDETGIRATAFP